MSETLITPDRIRNIAIIAHVDHGKTTLVDHLMKQSGMFRSNEQTADRMMDSMDLERERGITIAAKNASFVYKDHRINIVDTPGHADFGGEVERAMTMVDGCILLCDASEGPLPQTRFVLKKALELGLKVIVCINKIDRPDARINEVHNELFDLFVDLDASEEQTDFPLLYAVAREGYATLDPEVRTENLGIMFDWIIEKFPAPKFDEKAPLQMNVANLGYNDYVGRLGIGRVRNGVIKLGDQVIISQEGDKRTQAKVSALFRYEAMKQVPAESVGAGDIAILAGFDNINIGDSILSAADPIPLPRIKVEEPTVAVTMSVNDGPFAGLDGKNVTSRKILERLERELLTNVSIRVEPTNSPETFKVFGRGELQLGVLVEQMRREGFEMVIGKPQVVFKTENGEKMEPMEMVVVDVAEDFVGVVTQKLGTRKGVMTNMNNKGTGRVRIEFMIPARGLIGYRNEFLTDTRGTGLLNTNFAGYGPYRGDMETRFNGAMIADRKGQAVAYGLFGLQERGVIFVPPGTELYEGMIVGEHAKDNDLVVNASREKKLTNVRASGTDEAVKLVPIKPFTLEQALDWINDDECVEVTPKHIRIRCKHLDPNKRKMAAKE
ncbi:MAG: translational GTPase TypA [Proteobacteria bacterium]|nr:MAG: translational GTPase TypA [Pseudomonadota bacterium]